MAVGPRVSVLRRISTTSSEPSPTQTGPSVDFYRRVGQRMHDLLATHEPGAPLPHPAPLSDGVVIAPSESRMRPWDPVALPLTHPGVHVSRRARARNRHG